MKGGPKRPPFFTIEGFKFNVKLLGFGFKKCFVCNQSAFDLFGTLRVHEDKGVVQ